MTPSGFDSGEQGRDEYLGKRALANQWLTTSKQPHAASAPAAMPVWWGYYALASASVQQQDVAGKVRRNLPDPVPVILLPRLAVDRKEQSAGLGENLRRDTILRSVAASEIIGVRVLLVHALNDTASAFYTHFNFQPSPTDPRHLFLLMKDARSAAGC